MTVMPMFPLGMVVFPFTAVPLRVFEPRYQHLLDDVLAGDRTFGTVLIERGSEVGGGDERFDIGTIVAVSGVSRLAEADHRLVFVAGMQRVAVRSWMDDDPYPRADVDLLAEASEDVPAGLLDEVSVAVRRVLALASELGSDTSAIGVELSDDPVVASYQASALTPVTPLDAHRLLKTAGPASRLKLCRQMLAATSELLTHRLETGG